MNDNIQNTEVVATVYAVSIELGIVKLNKDNTLYAIGFPNGLEKSGLDI